jgi:hypothetical protein
MEKDIDIKLKEVKEAADEVRKWLATEEGRAEMKRLANESLSYSEKFRLARSMQSFTWEDLNTPLI